jgi:4-carboxymuconolactone decarboxylase
MIRPAHVRVPPAPVETAPVTSVMKASNVRRTLATNPTVAAAFSGFGDVVLNHGTIPPRPRELVILRMGWNCRSVYEFGQHTLMGRAVGLTDDEILHLTRPLDAWVWAAHELLLLRMVDELHANDCIGDELWAALEARYTHSEVLEYMASALFYRMISGVLNSCGVALDDGVPGWPAATSL